LPNDGGGTGGTGHPAVCTTWVGAAVNQAESEYVLADNGGHNDYYGNEVYGVKLRTDSPLWVMRRAPSTATGATDTSNGSATYTDGRPVSDHTYNLPVAARGKYWKMGFGAQKGGTGNTSSAIFNFDFSTNDWTSNGKAIATIGGNWTLAEGSAAYDPYTESVYCTTSLGGTGNARFSINVRTGAITTYSNSQDAGRFSWSAIIPQLRMWVVGSYLGSTETLRYIDITNSTTINQGFHDLNFSGSPTNLTPGYQGRYHRPSHAIFGWNDNAKSVIKLAVPATSPTTNTWVFSTVAAAAGGATPSGLNPNGMFGKFQLIEDMGDGCSAFVMVLETTGQVYVYRIPKAGL
jgi:hypothetical protein